MQKFNAGDVVRVLPGEGGGFLREGKEYIVAEMHVRDLVRVHGMYEDGSLPILGEFVWRFELVRTAEQEAARKKREAFVAACERDRIPARKTDPSTSQLAAKPKRVGLRERINQYMCTGTAATGEEIAAALDARLNSVTPRFAELQRAGILKDSGQRRNGQIVWVRA